MQIDHDSMREAYAMNEHIYMFDSAGEQDMPQTPDDPQLFLLA